MNTEVNLLMGLGLGAGMMYLLDPARGRVRRAYVRGKMRRGLNEMADAAETVAWDMRNRAQGLAAEGRAWLSREEVEDRVLQERIRSKIGRCVSHPRAIDVAVQHGRVALRGPILACEVDGLLSCVSSVPGVRGVEQHLDVHEHAGNLAALQGGRERPGERFELFQRRWSPATRFLIGAAGIGLLAYGATQRAPEACILGTLGVGLFAWGATNVDVRHWVTENSSRALQSMEAAWSQATQGTEKPELQAAQT